MLYALRGGAKCAKFIPRKVGHRVVWACGYLYGRLPTRLHKKLIVIHKRISPWMTESQAKRRAALVVASYSRYWWDVFWLSSPRTKKEIDAIVSVEGFDVGIGTIEDAKARGVGAIFALPHIGSWEVGGAWIAHQGFPPVVVVERLKPPELFELFKSTRESAGMTIIPHDEHPTGKLLAALKGGDVISLVSDRDINRKGIPITFFGDVKTFPAGAAALSLKTSAPIIPVCTYFNHDCTVTISFGDPIIAEPIDNENKEEQVRAVVENIVRQFEQMIERDPTQWHVLHDEWEKE